MNNIFPMQSKDSNSVINSKTFLWLWQVTRSRVQREAGGTLGELEPEAVLQTRMLAKE